MFATPPWAGDALGMGQTCNRSGSMQLFGERQINSLLRDGTAAAWRSINR
ncbi:hypothetical protein [Chloroflexus sp.]|nr:hypothetical protein [Chloroflexus sp.]